MTNEPTEYVPTTDEVRHYASTNRRIPPGWFDRWLAHHGARQMPSGEVEGALGAVRAIYDRYTEPGRFDALLADYAAEQQALALKEAAEAVAEIDGRRDDAAAAWLTHRADRIERQGRES